ncbi:MAG: hypothetical protein PWQ20_958 [Thermotogaceae bacterium]|nr:hypothetical protein [Thermotogaceae bacterium]MDN5337888.1 hypothetical protein [Thermotogaceae bacterium]
MVKKLVIYFLILPLFFSSTLGKPFIILTKPFSNSSVNLSGTPLIMELCLWNLNNYQGEAKLIYKDEKISFLCNIINPMIIDPTKWVWAYPEVYYGYKPWSQISVNQGDILSLPRKVRMLPNFELEIKYDILAPNWLSMNMALDSWITRKKYPTKAESGDVEVMIWLYSNKLKPAGKKVGEFSLQIGIDGMKKMFDWEIWYEKMDWDYIAFRIREPINGEEVTLPILEFFKKAKEILEKNSFISNSFDELYLEDLEFGSEFGNPFIPRAILEWNLEKFKIRVEQ